MDSASIGRRLRGAVRNGVVWGAAWFVLAVVMMLVLRTVGVYVPPEIGVLDMVGMGIRIGIVGGIAGGVFALLISQFYRGRRLSEINALRFGIGGAIVAELFLLVFFGLGGVLGGGFPALKDITSDLIIAAVFGGLTAGGSMWLAQRGEPSYDEDAGGQLDATDRPAAVGAGDRFDSMGAMEAADARERERAPRPSARDR